MVTFKRSAITGIDIREAKFSIGIFQISNFGSMCLRNPRKIAYDMSQCSLYLNICHIWPGCTNIRTTIKLQLILNWLKIGPRLLDWLRAAHGLKDLNIDFYLYINNYICYKVKKKYIFNMDSDINISYVTYHIQHIVSAAYSSS